MMSYLASDEEPEGGDTGKAERAFWEARECLVAGGHEDVLRQFDAIYLQEGRPVSVMLGQLREVLRLQASMVEVKDAEGGEVRGEVRVKGEESV